MLTKELKFMPNNLNDSAEAFKNAYLKLKQFINEDNGSELARAGILHAFEFTFELWWKYLQRYLDSLYILEELLLRICPTLLSFPLKFPRRGMWHRGSQNLWIILCL